MNTFQRAVAGLTALAVAGLLLVPPWVLRHDADWVGRVRAGHRFVGLAPDPPDFPDLLGDERIWYPAIDGVRLAIEVLLAIALGSAAVLFAGAGRRGDRTGDRMVRRGSSRALSGSQRPRASLGERSSNGSERVSP